MKPELIIDTPAALAQVFASRFVDLAREAMAVRGRFSWALPGGSVAETFLPILARTPLAWEKVDFFWGDERAVGPTDPDSNYGLARRLLLDPVQADAQRVHRIVGERDDLEGAAGSYEEEMRQVLGDPPRLDLVLLGLGPDGHVCSLFPGHPLLREVQRQVVVVTDSPKPPQRRITFTLLPLRFAATTYVVGFGQSKAVAIAAALADDASQLPVALAIRAAQRAVVLIDPPAASLLHAR